MLNAYIIICALFDAISREIREIKGLLRALHVLYRRTTRLSLTSRNIGVDLLALCTIDRRARIIFGGNIFFHIS